MLYNSLVCLDFESCSRDPTTTEITQIGAVALRPRDLELYPTFFDMRCRVLDESLIDPESLKITRTTVEEIRASPHPKEVWLAFARWVSQFNLGGKSDPYSAPVMAGHNIVNFDRIIYERYCYKYGPLKHDKYMKRDVPGIFNGIWHYDTMQLLRYWTENMKDPRSLSLDNLRDFFGMPKESKENAHDALQDVRDTAAILRRLLLFSRGIAPNARFKNCFDKAAQEKDRASEKLGAEAPDEPAKPKKKVRTL